MEYTIDNAKVDPFTGSEFEILLRNLSRHVLILAGLATNFGIEMTARSANERDYGVPTLVANCIGSCSDELVQFSFEPAKLLRFILNSDFFELGCNNVGKTIKTQRLEPKIGIFRF